jgi:hypothetical protein
MGFLWLPPLLVDADPSLDPTGAANKAKVAEVTAHQRDYDADVDWATTFYEGLLNPTEWASLRVAFERGFVWDDGLFTLEDMYAVEAANPEVAPEGLYDEPDGVDDDDDESGGVFGEADELGDFEGVAADFEDDLPVLTDSEPLDSLDGLDDAASDEDVA